MERVLFCLMLGALGCQPEMPGMMGGGPADGGRPDSMVGIPDGSTPFDLSLVDAVVPIDAAPIPDDPNALRINHLQMRATVNSYHDIDHNVDPELMGYVHLPLDEQAAEQGIRVFDFDFVPDPNGLFLDPSVTDLLLDNENHCGDWLRCLYQLDDWMDAHPEHPLVVVLVAEAMLFANPAIMHFQLDDIERQAVTALGRERLLTPADVRRGHPDLRTAIQARGWPTVEATRGKAMLVLNDRGLPRTFYLLEGGQDPTDRLLFQIGDPALADHPDAGDEVIFTFEPNLDEEDFPWFFETDPADLPRIEELAASGYLVHAISDDPEMLANLRAAGTHFVGTRFPDRLDPIPVDGPTVCNPISRPIDCNPEEIEPAR